MNCFKHDNSVLFLTYCDMKLFDSDNIWLNDMCVMCFLRCMSLQSSKIAVLDLMFFKDYHLQHGKTMRIICMITELNLIIVPSNHFYLFLFIRIEKKKFLVMQLDSLYLENITEEMSSLNEWFLCNDIVKNEKLELELFYSNEYNLQTDSFRCA